MTHLETAAREQRESLQLAVMQQNRYDRERQQLEKTIAEAEEKLKASSVTATSVAALKQQIADRNTLTAQIQQDKIKVNEIVERQRQLFLDSAQLSPNVFRKHYLPESAYSDYFSAAAQHQRGTSPLPTSSNLFYDTMSTFVYDTPRLSDAPASMFSDSDVNHSRDSQAGLSPASERELPSLSFELPKKIPPPRTDSIPRPTWSDNNPALASPSHELASSLSLTRSLDSPLTTTLEPAVEVGPTVPASKYFSSPGRVSSLAEQLTSSVCPLEDPPVFGGVPTEIIRMLSVNTPRTAGKQTEVGDDVLNKLQQEMDAKEKQLEASMQKQEEYQQAVQDLTAKIERVSIRLAESPASQSASLDNQMLEYQEVLKEIDTIKEEIERVKDLSQELASSSDLEGQKTTKSTLTMLEDRLHNLQTMAEDKGKTLQEAKTQKENHAIAHQIYNTEVDDLRRWLEETKLQSSGDGLEADEIDLQWQLDQNKVIQEEINKRLCLMSDLALQCDQLCGSESPETAEILRSQLATLQNDLGQFKLFTIEKQNQLRAALKEAERKKREKEEQEALEQQQWMADINSLTLDSDSSSLSLQRQFSKELVTDLQSHKQLVQEISDHKLRAAAHKQTSETEIRLNWQRLSSELAVKKQSLEAILRSNNLGDLMKVRLNSTGLHESCNQKLEEVRLMVSDIGHQWDQLAQGQITAEDIINIQEQYQSALESLSVCLDLAQEQLFTGPAASQDHLRLNQNLQRQMQSIKREVTNLIEHVGVAFSSVHNFTNQDVIKKCLEDLKDWEELIGDTAVSQGEDLAKADRERIIYLAELTDLRQSLQDMHRLLAPSGRLSLEDQLENSQLIEAQLQKCESQLQKLRESNMSAAHGNLSELNTLQSTFMDIQRKAMENKSSLQNSVAAQGQYQKMIHDYEIFLETAQEKLKLDSISARDLNHLKQQLSAHKDFFSDLEVHKAMLESLAGQCDPAGRSRFHQKHLSLSNTTTVMVDQASLHGQRLERLTKQWTELDEKYMRLQKVLTQIEHKIPQPITSGDSLITIQDKLSRYKALQSELAEERQTVFDVVDRGKQILHSVNCSSLETIITDLAEKWVTLNTELSHEIKRTETLGDHLLIFEEKTALLSSWLSGAKIKLAGFKQLSSSDLQNIAAVRTKVEKLLEFRKEVENQVTLKNHVIDVGNKLLQNKDFDTRGLSDRLRNYEEEWVLLERGISETEEYLHQAQMDLMPSRQALSELFSWIEEIRQSLRQDAKKKIKTVADIEKMLKRYKDYKVELSTKKMTHSFVNQSVLAPQPEEEDVPNEKMEFAEKLGELNRQWMEVEKSVTERLTALESVHAKWEEFEKSCDRLQSWFSEQEEKVRHSKLVGHEVGVRQILKDCQAMLHQLEDKKSELASIRALGTHLIDMSEQSPGCQQSVRDSMAALELRGKKLAELIRQLEDHLKDMASHWQHYQADLMQLNQVVTHIEYALNHYTLIGGDIGTLRSQVAKLKGLKSELTSHSPQLDAFSDLANQLRQVCEPSVQIEIQKTLADLQTKWRTLDVKVTERCHQFEQSLQSWQNFESLCGTMEVWLDKKEVSCADLISYQGDPLKCQVALDKLRQMEAELDGYQVKVSQLAQMSDSLTKNMNSSTISMIKSRQTMLEQRMVALRQLLSQQMSALANEMSLMGQFNKAFEVVQKFLNNAGVILKTEDPQRSSEEHLLKSRLHDLRQLLLLFSTNYSKLDTVNDLGYRLALNEFDAVRLRELNHKWQRLYEETSERSRTLQGHLLVQQDFTSKCQAWMTFLALTEQDLAREVRGNLEELREQLEKCQHFGNEAYSQQQILQAIISDGHRMLRAGEVEDKEDFQRKLQLVAEQWQSLSRRVNQRQAIIRDIIGQWHQFNSLSTQVKQWLALKEEEMKACEVGSDSVYFIRNLVERIKISQHEFQLQEETYKKVQELGHFLLQYTDVRSAQAISATLADLEKGWKQILNNLGIQRSRLEHVDREWLVCEEEMEGILGWLKDIRLVLSADIPTTYDQLQAEIKKCQDIALDFSTFADKRQELVAKERKLGQMVETEDVNLLHQRIKLLNKQWEELYQQTQLREQRLTEALLRWTNVGDSIRSLMEWIQIMEAKIISNKDLHVEELLAKLEKEYKREMEEKEKEKSRTVQQAENLMKISSDIRASDLQQKMLRLEDRWQHLQAFMDYRLHKLQETVLAVHQLDTSMNNLSKWLSNVENELTAGIAFKDTDFKEIEDKMLTNQELQRDIERHSTGISSVLNLCEVLLHDSDACPTEKEFLSLQHAMKNLEKRWRNICALCPQRRTRLEETWQLWEIFRDDCQRFSNWMAEAESGIQDSELDVTNIRTAKEVLNKYEILQHNVHDHLGDLEHINRQYRQLAKEGRTDADGSLKVQMTMLNNRWDALQLRVTEMMKKLRHSASIREDFEMTLKSLVSWLQDIDLQLSRLQDLTSLDWEAKVSDIRRIEDEIHTRRHRMEYLDQAAFYLIQKGDSQEALRVQRQLDDFKALSKQVFEKVVTTQLKVERMLVAQGDITTPSARTEDRLHMCSAADRIQAVKDAQSTRRPQDPSAGTERYFSSPAPESPAVSYRSSRSPSRISISSIHRTSSPVVRTTTPVRRSQSPSPIRSASPFRRSASPVGRLTSPIRMSTPSVKRSTSPSKFASSRRRSPSPEKFSPIDRTFSPIEKDRDVPDGRASPRHELSKHDKSLKTQVLMEGLVDALEDCNTKLVELDKSMELYRDTDLLVQQLLECEVAVDHMLRLHRLLQIELDPEIVPTADAQVSLVKSKFESLQKRAMDEDYKITHDRHDLLQFTHDLDNMLKWLGEAEALQSTHRPLPVDIGQLDVVIRQFKDLSAQLESKKPIIYSINLISRNYLQGKNVKAHQIEKKLQDMNRRWELVLSRAFEIERALQVALIECQEFHHKIHDYQLWLEDLETRLKQCEPMDLSADKRFLWEKYRKIVDISSELKNNQSNILSLKETADQLLVRADSQEMLTARDKTHIISNRLRSLLHLSSAYISSLENKLQMETKSYEGKFLGAGSSRTSAQRGPALLQMRTKPAVTVSRKLFTESTGPLLHSSSKDRDNLNSNTRSLLEATGQHQVRPSLLMRVICAAIPFYLLLLCFLLLACLFPVCDDENNCLLKNNLRNSFSPMLHYTDGAPPT